jgi:CubicO group peptidase (beta-lactamase class C family)
MHAAEKASDWTTGLPEEVGLDSAALVEMFDYVPQHKVPVHSIQIVRHGRMVLDAYFYPYGVEMRHDVASVTKSITSTLVGLAIQKGYLREVQQPLLSLFPGRTLSNLDERKRRITLEHLLTMQSGWDCGFEPKEARLFEMRRSGDWLQFMLDLPMVADQEPVSPTAAVIPVLNCASPATGTNALGFARRGFSSRLNYDVLADRSSGQQSWLGRSQLHPRDIKLGQLFSGEGAGGSSNLSES